MNQPGEEQRPADGQRPEGRAEGSPVDLDRFRDYLRFLARAHLYPSIRGKVDPSDIVQETFLQAHRNLSAFRGETTGELASWLRQILARSIMQAARHYGFDKRNVKLERSVEQQLADSSSVLGSLLSEQGPGPSEQASRDEQMLLLAAAVERLPEAQRTAIVLHYWQRLSLKEVAEQLGRSPEAVAGLIFRGLKSIRQGLPADS